jgi:type IV fimbrial biogenesis protein FimT
MVTRSAGFTLIEVMVVVAIIAILATLAVPSFARLIASTAVSGHVNTFMADARYARSEAMKRGRSVTMCRSDAPESSAPTCSSVGGTDWSNGWLIFIDTNSNGAFNGGEVLLRIQPQVSNSGGIATTGGAFNTFTYGPLGRSNNNGTLLVKGKGDFSGVNRNLIIDTVGRVRWEAVS